MGASDKVVQRILRHSRPHVTKERYIKVFDRTVLEAAEKMQKRIEELRQAKEPCRQLELSFGDGVERPRTALAEHPAFSRLGDSSHSGQQLASTLILNTTESYLKLSWRVWSKSRRWMQLGEIWRRGGIRTPGRGFGPYNGLAHKKNCPIPPPAVRNQALRFG